MLHVQKELLVPLEISSVDSSFQALNDLARTLIEIYPKYFPDGMLKKLQEVSIYVISEYSRHIFILSKCKAGVVNTLASIRCLVTLLIFI